MNIGVLGAGLVGGPIAVDLQNENNFDVTSVDIDDKKLQKLSEQNKIKTIAADLQNETDLRSIVTDFDLVINAVPGFMGFNTLRTLIEEGKNVIDIAFYPEDSFLLNNLAVEKDVIVITDIGIAPGMSNVLAAYAHLQLDDTENISIYVGGLPKVRTKPYEYKAVFSPIDVIEEYIRPARIVENGKEVVKPALSEIELLEFEKVGTLEAFNSDGLRSLIRTIDCPNMKEKTLRYPGHAKKMELLRESGFFGYKELNIKGKLVKPIDITSQLLFPLWQLQENEEDITVMKIIVEGSLNGKKHRITYELFDEYDLENNVHSMARTTGFTATEAAKMVAANVFDEKGLTFPEYLARDKKYVSFLLDGLKAKNINFKFISESLE